MVIDAKTKMLVGSFCTAALACSVACAPTREPAPAQAAPSAAREVLPAKPNEVDDPSASIGRLSWQLRKGLRAVSIRLPGAEYVRPRDLVDLMVVVSVHEGGPAVGDVLAQRVAVLAVDTPPDAEPGERELTCTVLPEQAELIALAARVGVVRVSLSNPDDLGGVVPSDPMTIPALLAGQALRALHQKRMATFQRVRMPGDAPPPAASPPADRTQATDAQALAACSVQPPRLSVVVDPGARAMTVQVAGLGHVARYDHVDLLWTTTDPETGQPVCRTLMGNLIAARVDAPDRLTVLVLPREAKALALAAHTGRLTASLRNPEDLAGHEQRAPTTVPMLLDKDRSRELMKKIQHVGWGTIRRPGPPANYYLPPQPADAPHRKPDPKALP